MPGWMLSLGLNIGIQLWLVAAPPVLLGTTWLVFRYGARRFGATRGYLAGFLFYWIGWCICLPLLTVGPAGFRTMFSLPAQPFGRPAVLGILLLIGPVAGSFFAVNASASRLKEASLTNLLLSAAFALVNGTLEEVLWRGTYLAAFDGHWLWGYLYPSAWFGLWHLAPAAAFTERKGALRFALMAIFLGLSFGWVALTSLSIIAVSAAHILLDFPGLPAYDFTDWHKKT